MKVSLISFHVNLEDLSIKDCVYVIIGMVGFVTSTTSLVLSSKASFEATRWVVGDIVPTNDERVIRQLAGTRAHGSTLMATQNRFKKSSIYYKQ